MPRGPKKEITYTGKAAKINEKVIKLESDLKAAKEELKAAYKEQLKAEKTAARKAEKDAAMAAKKALKENKTKLMKAIEVSGKTPEEILAFLQD